MKTKEKEMKPHKYTDLIPRPWRPSQRSEAGCNVSD
jgi:hypothetical protein